MMNKRRIAWLSVFVALTAPACAATVERKSTGTNWLDCQTNADCAALEGSVCGAQGICIDGAGHPIPKTQVSQPSPDGSTAGLDASITSHDGSTTGAVWARTDLSPATSALFNSTAVDVTGNVYAAGDLSGPGTLDFGNRVTATGTFSGDNALLVKYDSSGTAQWQRTIGTDSIGADFGSVALDSTGNVYVAGHLLGSSGALTLGNGIFVSKPATSNYVFLVKYDSSGTAQWAQTVTLGDGDSSFYSVTLDSSGAVRVAGEIDGPSTYDFGNGVTATGVFTGAESQLPTPSALLVEYDSSGTAQWAHAVTAGYPSSTFSSVAVDTEGNSYAAGSIAGTDTYDFGNGVAITGTGGNGPIAGESVGSFALVKYDSSGIAQWARTSTAGPTAAGFNSVAVDPSGNVFAAGYIQEGTFDFGNGVTAAGTTVGGDFTGTAGSEYVLLVKYDSTGTAQWARTVNPGGSNSYLNSVAVDLSGNAYVAGAVHSTGIYDFGTGATLSTDDRDVGYYSALVKYDPSGVAQWVHSSSVMGSTADVFTAITVDAAGTVYAAGYLGETGVVDFGSGVTAAGTHVATGSGWSPLLVKY